MNGLVSNLHVFGLAALTVLAVVLMTGFERVVDWICERWPR